jgi:hypothetical protein
MMLKNAIERLRTIIERLGTLKDTVGTLDPWNAGETLKRLCSKERGRRFSDGHDTKTLVSLLDLYGFKESNVNG